MVYPLIMESRHTLFSYHAGSPIRLLYFCYCTFVGSNLVTWTSKKQSVVAQSSVEAEYRAMAHGVCELLWIKGLMQDLGMQDNGLLRLYYDNKAAISIVQNPVQHDRTNHIEIDRHFIKEKVLRWANLHSFMRSEVFTKGLCSKLFHTFIPLCARRACETYMLHLEGECCNMKY